MNQSIVLLFLSSFLLSLAVAAAAENVGSTNAGTDAEKDAVSRPKPLQVLVIGGTQFMGRLLIESLIKEDSTKKGKPKNLYNISMLNRGRTHNPFKTSKHKLYHLKCDRQADREGCIKLLQEKEEDWDWIVDFTGFHPEQIDDLMKGLLRWDRSTSSYRLAVRRYVYISTDSVYMACEAPKHDGYVTETDDTVAEGEYALWLKARDEHQFRYGGLKRQCELTLMNPPSELNIKWPYTILRLPDVVGPYDNQGIWSQWQSAMTLGRTVRGGISKGHMRPRPLASLDWNRRHDVSDYKTLRFSIVYAPDVVRAIMAVLKSKSTAPIGQVYNIATEEVVTLDEIFDTIGENLGIDPIVDEDSRSFIPTTDFGSLSIRKALKELDWKPTPMEEWAPGLVDWYRDPRNIDYHVNVRNSIAASESASEWEADEGAEDVKKGKKRKSSKSKGKEKKKRKSKQDDEL